MKSADSIVYLCTILVTTRFNRWNRFNSVGEGEYGTTAACFKSGSARRVRGDLSVADLAVCLTDGASSAVKNKVNLARYII